MSELGPSPLAASDAQITVDEARRAIAAVLEPVTGTDTLPLHTAAGRVLAADVASPIDVPAHDNSAMDGYAFDGRVLAADAPTRLEPVGTVYAGAPFAGVVGAGECVRIMTGAVIPEGLDTVVPLELCRAVQGLVHIEPGRIQRGENLRRRGEDLSRGRAALTAGRVLRPADLGLLASLGFTTVKVRRRLRVAVFSTGDEVQTPGEPLRAGCIYDSNRTSLLAALARLDMEAVDLGLVRDDPAALQATLDAALAQADAVITSGGVSAGDADYTREVLARMGEVAFWKVAMRPGRPFAFGPLKPNDARRPQGRTAWLFALPGNPVAALVTFYAFARDALLQLAGAVREPMPVLQARSAVALRKRPGRTEFQRGILFAAEDGTWQVRPTGSQGAGVLRSMSEANCLVVLGHEQGSVAAGEPVTVWLFEGLV